MKKTTTLFALGATALLISACASGFNKHQTVEQTMQPFNCFGLHMKNAQWHFVDDFGQSVDATGTCKKGMKHGNFQFFINNELVAKVKYSRDNEVQTYCAQTPGIPKSLAACMEYTARNSAVNQAPIDANDQNDFLDEE